MKTKRNTDFGLSAGSFPIDAESSGAAALQVAPSTPPLPRSRTLISIRSLRPGLARLAIRPAAFAAPALATGHAIFKSLLALEPVPAVGHRPLSLTTVERKRLIVAFGAVAVEESLQHDVFDCADALHRQLTHEHQNDMSPEQYYRLDPAGLPPGWRVDDCMTNRADGLQTLRTILHGPGGECGRIVRGFDGQTLHLDEAYKCSLPSKIANVPGYAQPFSTMNYLTARACKILNVSSDNLASIKINRLQHRPTLAHFDWLQQQYPDESLSQLIGHTTWVKKNIRQVALNIGHELEPKPEIFLQGSPEWIAAHPGAPSRAWAYTEAEAQRLTIKHITGQEIVEVDTANTDWQACAAEAIRRFKQERCAHLSESEAAVETQRIDELIAARLQALRQSDLAVGKRYGFRQDYAPKHLNFDVRFCTRRLAQIHKEE
ncbi:MAG: hypothetical protein V4695_07150 [Pseudomonadota bacterium]